MRERLHRSSRHLACCTTGTSGCPKPRLLRCRPAAACPLALVRRHISTCMNSHGLPPLCSFFWVAMSVVLPVAPAGMCLSEDPRLP